MVVKEYNIRFCAVQLDLDSMLSKRLNFHLFVFQRGSFRAPHS